MSGINFGSILDDDMQNIVFNQCSFTQLYKGIKVGESTTGSGSSVNGPEGVRVTNSFFDEIYGVGLQTYTAGQVTSAYNTFKDVGNHSIATPTENVILFGGNGNSSIHDIFYRTDIQDLTVARIAYANTKSIYMNPKVGLQVGLRQLAPGGTLTLTDNTAETEIDVTFPISSVAQKIHYVATRGSDSRHGTIDIIANSGGTRTISDSFVETADIGLVFYAHVSATAVILAYETTSTGSDVSFKYSVDRIVV
jgi:hypothetical protein